MSYSQHLVGNFIIPPVLDVVAIILFAITGALSAAKRDYDWIGIIAIALVTGCGGGLIRDILLNVRPVILEHEPYLWAVIAAVLLSVYFCNFLSRLRWVFIGADALGLAMYAVFGTQKTLLEGFGLTAAILVGTLNSIGGGLIRDILTREEVSLLKPGQWYTVIGFGASTAFGVGVCYTDFPAAAVGAVVVVLAFAARLLASHFDLQTRPIKPIGFEASRW